VRAAAFGALLALACATSGGAYYTTEIQPHQWRAMGLIWEAYGSQRPMPEVRWVRPPRLNCHEGQGFLVDGACLAGFARLSYVVIALPDGYLFSRTALAHEMFHAHLLQTTGRTDPMHTHEGFAEGGAVEVATRALEHEGL
jgi:hypothetical protein